MSLTPTNTFLVTSASAGATLTCPSFTPATNDIIIVKASTEDAGTPMNTPTATGGGITWTQRVTDSTANHCFVSIWTGIVTSGGSAITVSSSPANGTVGFHSMEVEQWPGASCKLASSPATAKTLGSTGTATTTITTAASGSAVSWLDADWSAKSPTGRTYSTTSATPTEEGIHDGSTADYVAYYLYQQAATAGSQTFGVTVPTGQTYSLLAIEVQAVSSGTNYSKTPSDSEKLTDSAATTQQMVRSASDSEKLTDSVALNRTLPKSETEKLTDAVALIRSTTAADSEKLTDSAAITQSMQRAASDSEKLTDSASATQAMVRAPADSEKLTDAASATQALSRAATDSERLTDSISSTQSLQRTQSDSERLTDSVAATQSMVRAPSDSLKMTDSVTVSINGGGTNYTKTPSDSLKMTDSVQVTQTINRAPADSLKLTDSPATTQSMVRSASETLKATDAATSSTSFVRTPSDSLKMTDSESQVQSMSRSVNDSAGLKDSTTRTRQIFAAIVDALKMTDSTTVTDLANAHLADFTFWGMFRRWKVAGLAARRWNSRLLFRRWKVTLLDDRYPVGTVEYAPLPITKLGAAVTNSTVTAVNISLVPSGQLYGPFNVAGTYIDGYWCVPTAGLAANKYAVWAQLTTSTGETPILYCGTLNITNLP